MARAARVGYVPFNSETLVTGKLFEDIRDAVFELADPRTLRRRRHHQPVRADRVRRAAAAAAEGDQRRAHHRHRRAGLRRADACRGEGRAGRRHARAMRAPRPSRGRCRRRATGAASKPTVTLVGEMFPADPVGIGMLLEPIGLAAGPVVPTREWRELYAALDCAAVAAIHPFYTASFREFDAAGRAIVGSGAGRPRRHRRLAGGDRRRLRRCRRRQIDCGEEPLPARDQGRAGEDARSRAASRCRATRARSCWWRGC